MASETWIEVNDVSKRFRYTTALNNVSLKVKHPSLVFIRGPNGSGKTTLLKIICGLVRPSKGSVNVMGISPTKDFERLQELISFYFEDDPLPWWTSGKEFLEYIAFMKGFELEKLDDAIKGLKVDRFWDRKIYTYSSGMRRKIQILKALIGDGKVLVLDEPLTLLDRESKRYLLNYLTFIKGDKTVLIASHIDEGLSQIADMTVYIEDGMIVDVNL